MTTNGFECRNCRGHEARLLYGAVPDRFHGFEGRFSYVTCQACGLVQIEHVTPDPGAFYGGYRVHSGDSAVYRALRRLTIGHCYLEQPGRGRSLLDVGCGNGFYIEQMSRRGWHVVGYEFDPGYASELSTRLGLEVIAGEQALSVRREQFDLVTFNFSFEHLDQPLPLLELVASCLRPGGEIYISVPNIESREAAMFEDRWFHLDPPRHISFFTKELLRTALEERGFSDVAIRDLPVPTGLAGSLSYRLWDRFEPLTWYAGILPGMLFSAIVRDGNFAISARKSS